MFAATKVSQALPRAAHRAGIGNPQRTIHTNVHPRLSQTKTFVTRLVARFLPNQISSASSRVASTVAPKVASFTTSTGARVLHVTPSSVQQALSFPARVALSRPLTAPRLPRVPTVPRFVTQVGLGTARNFSSSRPIFQNLVDNVPVVGRAFWEAEWDIKSQENIQAHKLNRPVAAKKSSKGKTAEMMKPKRKLVIQERPVEVKEIDHYFPEATAPSVTTYLRIPLAPTPTSRVPLGASSNEPHLIPLTTLAISRATHADHANLVSYLFAKLDAAQVWERGAKTEAWGDSTGLCTVLSVAFVGWTERMVREVIGVEGMEWCSVQEVRKQPDDDELSNLSGSTPSVMGTIPSMPSSPLFLPSSGMAFEDPQSMEFVLPTLDFSSSFLSVVQNPESAPNTRPTSPLFFSDGQSDFGSDESFSDLEGGSTSHSDVESLTSHASTASASTGRGWFAFSSDFTNRTGVPEDFYF